MALADVYVQVYGQLGEVFRRISEGQAPNKFTTQYLKDLGFTSTNFRAVIPLLKTLGFLSEDGAPTNRYHEYRNKALSKRVLGEALREAYSDLFTIKANPSSADRELIEGKFRSAHNASSTTAERMASTFFALLELADFSVAPPKIEKQAEPASEDKKDLSPPPPPPHHRPTLHYNIQIHLPATKDIEVFNAIFKSLRAHLLD